MKKCAFVIILLFLGTITKAQLKTKNIQFCPDPYTLPTLKPHKLVSLKNTNEYRCGIGLNIYPFKYYPKERLFKNRAVNAVFGSSLMYVVYKINTRLQGF